MGQGPGALCRAAAALRGGRRPRRALGRRRARGRGAASGGAPRGGPVTEIRVGPGLLGRLPALVARHAARRRATLVTDSRLAAGLGRTIAAAFRRAGWEAPLFVLPRGEAAKTLRQAERLWAFLAQTRHERRDPVVALGGGTVGDAAGFGAATWMRGVPLVQVPTTLLAQSDSCLGGKTGVNIPVAKNAVGAFHQPALVVADPAALAGLPERDYASGLAEVVKYGLVLDGAFARALDRRWPELAARRPAAVAWAVKRALELKARVVAADERDLSGRRELLNFGHTLGHALESASGYAVRHGEAVAFGMRAAVLLSRGRGGLSRPADAALVSDLLARLPSVRVPAGVRAGDLAERLLMDKKARGGRPVFVLLKGLARPERTDVVTRAQVLAVLAQLGVRP
ncbi:3-dehydroquinate synthase [bacterium]|nr:MAG: 3-dehydroquinate synthase [bacterium]